MVTGAEELGIQSRRGDMEQHKRAKGEGWGHRNGSRRAFRPLAPVPYPFTLMRLTSGSAMPEVQVFPSCFAAVSGPLSRMTSTEASSLDTWDCLVGNCAMPSPRETTEEGAWGSGLQHRALAASHIAMVAGPIPPCYHLLLHPVRYYSMLPLLLHTAFLVCGWLCSIWQSWLHSLCL